MRRLAAIAGRDIALAFRAGGGAMQVVLFFALAALVFALAIGPDPTALRGLAAPILWTLALLAALVSLDRLFESDFEDGSLDALVETGDPLELSILAKACAHWTSALLPVVAATPLIAILLNLPANALQPLLLSLVIGTPALSLIGAIAAAVAVGLRRAGVLVAVLSAPLYAPTLIFGVSAAGAGAEASPAALPSFLILAAITLLAAIIGPIAGAAAIRFNMG
jgi:heme exporter protein B